MNFLSSPLLLLLLSMTLSFFSLIHAREHYTLQCPKGWALYRSKTKTENDPSKCIKLIGPKLHKVPFSEAQEYCTEKLPLQETEPLVESQMLRLTSAAQIIFLNGYFKRPGSDETQPLLYLGLQYRPEDERWHWATATTKGVDGPKSGPLVEEGFALEMARHSFDLYTVSHPGTTYRPDHPMCVMYPGFLAPENISFIAADCDQKFRPVCESKPKKVEMPDNGMDDDEIKEKFDSLSTKMEAMSKELESLRLPLGFIYVQLPGEKEPSELWPVTDLTRYQWTDVSKSYDSLFFRVGGKHAAPFGSVQQQQQIGLKSKFIDGIKRERCQLNSDRSDCIESDKKKYGLGNKDKCSNNARVSFSVNLTSSAGEGESGDAVCSNDGWSAPVWTAFNYASLNNDSYYDDVKSYADYHQYHLSSGSGSNSENAEIRPRNMAVKVWKRTG